MPSAPIRRAELRSLTPAQAASWGDRHAHCRRGVQPGTTSEEGRQPGQSCHNERALPFVPAALGIDSPHRPVIKAPIHEQGLQDSMLKKT